MLRHIVIRVSGEVFEAHERAFGKAGVRLPRHEPEISSRMLDRLDRWCATTPDEPARLI
jgi:hypothetical protein